MRYAGLLEVNCLKMQTGGVMVRKSNGDLFAVFCRDDSNKPDYHNKYVMINCFKYRINWNREGKPV